VLYKYHSSLVFGEISQTRIEEKSKKAHDRTGRVKSRVLCSGTSLHESGQVEGQVECYIE